MMWRIVRVYLLVAAAFLCAVGFGQAAEYTVDPAATEVGFSVGFLFGTVNGRFQKVEGQAVVTDGKLQSVKAVMQAESVYTGNGTRDKHLRSDHFFDAPKFPTVEFQSTSITDGADGALRVKGMLTMRGISREIELVGNLAPEGDRYVFQAEGQVIRHDWKVSWNQHTDGRDLTIKDQVKLVIKGQLAPAT